MGMTVKIVLAGEGGQGVQSVAEIIAEVANEAGQEALYIPNFGVEQRGGVSIAFLQIGDKPIGAPKFQKADIVVVLSDRAVLRTSQYVGPETIFIYDEGITGVEEAIPRHARKVLAIPAMQVAKEDLDTRVFNIIIMGAVIRATKVVSQERAKKGIEKKLGYKFEKNPRLRELNFMAIERGAELVAQVL